MSWKNFMRATAVSVFTPKMLKLGQNKSLMDKLSEKNIKFPDQRGRREEGHFPAAEPLKYVKAILFSSLVAEV